MIGPAGLGSTRIVKEDDSMNPTLSQAFCGLLLAASLDYAQAARVYRCVTDSGAITFSQQGCQANEHAQVVHAENQRPGTGRAVPMAKPKRLPKRQTAADAEVLTVVGSRDTHCSTSLSDKALRTAVIRQQIKPGMTIADVERALGRPDSVSSSNGQLRYRYLSREKNGRTRTITFDGAGCVRGKP